jgi:hypothetical protein
MTDYKLGFEILAAAFAAGGAIAALRFAQNKTAKDLNFVGNKVRTLEAARVEDRAVRLEERIDIALALYDATPDDKRRAMLHDLLRPHRRH